MCWLLCGQDPPCSPTLPTPVLGCTPSELVSLGLPGQAAWSQRACRPAGLQGHGHWPGWPGPAGLSAMWAVPQEGQRRCLREVAGSVAETSQALLTGAGRGGGGLNRTQLLGLGSLGV